MFRCSVDDASEIRGGDDEAQMNWGYDSIITCHEGPQAAKPFLLRHLERLRRDGDFQLQVTIKADFGALPCCELCGHCCG
jgi:hypothetical protein